MRRWRLATPIATQRNWCTAVEASIEGASPGAKTITLGGTMELIISDAAYIAMDAAELANTYGFMRIALQDSGNSNTKLIEIGGYITQFDHNFNGTGPSDVTTSFRASERRTPTS